MIRKSFFLYSVFGVLFFSLFASCSNHETQFRKDEEFETLKEESEYLTSTTVWSEELEQDRLTSKIKSIEGINSKQKLSNICISARSQENLKKHYPSLSGLGSLDTSLIPYELKGLIKDFFEKLSQNQNCEELFREESLYCLALFNYDLGGYLSDFDEFFKKENPGKYFTSYTLAEPFLEGTSYSVPVRFISRNYIMDLNIFAEKIDSQWKIDQIRIVSVENK